ncbi:hypothetical protein R1flu_016575 [Riccia fluitans]|uniref:Uncharacterized protein n=1 Tax=Riccia fluitans TaxID=41844 RepID=A0ABD1YN90_9MARC
MWETQPHISHRQENHQIQSSNPWRSTSSHVAAFADDRRFLGSVLGVPAHSVLATQLDNENSMDRGSDQLPFAREAVVNRNDGGLRGPRANVAENGMSHADNLGNLLGQMGNGEGRASSHNPLEAWWASNKPP